MSAAGRGESYTGPCRLLLETHTHLVHGDEWVKKVKFLRNIVCNSHFNRDFDPQQDRYYLEGDDFGLPSRPCYLLVDHGDKMADAKSIRLFRYRWTGDKMSGQRDNYVDCFCVLISSVVTPSTNLRLRKCKIS